MVGWFSYLSLLIILIYICSAKWRNNFIGMNHCAWQHAIRNFSTLNMWVGLYVFQLIQYLVLSSNTSPLMNIIISGTKVHMRCVNNELMDWFAFGSVNQMPSSSLCQTKTGLRTSFSVLFYVLFFLNLFFWITNYKVYRKKVYFMVHNVSSSTKDNSTWTE